VQVDPSLKVPAQTAEVIFRLVSEGLSNVLRHTAARIAKVVIRSAGIWCTVEIANPLANGAPPPQPFVPASIAERAAGLGGRILVEAARKGHTTVTVWLPRHAMTS
jgi:signal transduction histidine kinase